VTQLRWAAMAVGMASVAAAGNISDVQPGSNLLPAETRQIQLEFRAQPGAGDCRLSLNERKPHQEMTPATRLVAAADVGAGGGVSYKALIEGLDTNPARVNEVFVKCSDAPEEETRLLYRVLSAATAPAAKESVRLARVGTAALPGADLQLGGAAAPAGQGQVALLRAPLTAADGLPENHYLHDTQGRRIGEPGAWRLNLTRPDVAAAVARNAYGAMVASGLLYDGCYFDGAPPRMSIGRDGKRVIPDTDEDGRADFTERLDTEWSRGLYRAVALWRKQMPNAYAVADGTVLPTATETAEAGGLGVVLQTRAITEGREAFQSAWGQFSQARAAGASLPQQQPDLCVVAAAPPSQISTGYGEKPLEQAPPATVDFARASYRPMRFGLSLALLSGCAFQFDLGEAGRAARWSYDEYAFELGTALGAPERAAVAEANPANRIANPGFENPLAGSWALFTHGAAGVLAFVDRDADAAEGRWSARTTIQGAGQAVPWHVNLYQSRWALRGGQSYDLEFWAKADVARTIGLAAQKSAPDFRNYGLWETTLELSPEWRRYRMTFVAVETAADAQLQFLLGARTGRVWLDGVRLTERPPDVLSRRFSQGMVLVNASPDPQTVVVEGSYRRFTGGQAPRVDTILDDADARFQLTSGEWNALRLDSGEWEALGPFYHHWNKGLRQSADPAAAAEWPVVVEDESIHQFSAWWPAAPYRESWTGGAVYELLADGVVIASKAVDQRIAGDRWEPLFEAPLLRARRYQLRIRNQGEGILTADAVRVVSVAAPRNDGSVAAPAVTLAPFDAVLLRK
jgi:hypothetical protein